jgi:protease II
MTARSDIGKQRSGSRLRANKTGENVLLLRVNMGAGHAARRAGMTG